MSKSSIGKKRHKTATDPVFIVGVFWVNSQLSLSDLNSIW